MLPATHASKNIYLVYLGGQVFECVEGSNQFLFSEDTKVIKDPDDSEIVKNSL